MSNCIKLAKEMLVSPILFAVNDRELTYSTAKEIADREALKINPDAMLLAWFDRKSGLYSPKVE